MKLIPYGSVACCVKADDDRTSVLPVQGQAFCFLPLPVRTGLPVHVNGYFEVSSNRRDIWKADDTSGESKVRSNWNDLLLRDVIAPLYARLVAYKAAEAKKLEIVGHTWLLPLLPCPAPPPPWLSLVAQPTFSLLKSELMFCSEMGNCVSLDQAFALDQDDQRLSTSDRQITYD